MKEKKVTITPYLFGFTGDCSEAGELGNVSIDRDMLKVSIQITRSCIPKATAIVNHGSLGDVPHWRACLYDMFMQGYETLLMEIEP